MTVTASFILAIGGTVSSVLAMVGSVTRLGPYMLGAAGGVMLVANITAVIVEAVNR